MSDSNYPKLPDYDDGARKIGTVNVPITPDIVHEIGAEERQVLRAQKTCGQCKHFDRKNGQAEMRASKFLEALTDKKQFAWQLRHLANPANHMGFCGAENSGAPGEGRVLTAIRNSAENCSMYRPHNGLVTLNRKSGE